MSEAPLPDDFEDLDGTIIVPDEAEPRSLLLDRCQEQLGYVFRNPQLLQEALTHSSIAPHRLASNERLEFLGDAVLGLVVCRWLYELFPNSEEGDLTRIKSSVVSRRCCVRAARRLGLESYLIVGKGLHRLQGGVPRSLLSDVFEAVLAAMYLDGGLDPVTRIVRETLLEELNTASDTDHSGNYKSVLQQYAQRNHGCSPTYRLISATGPDHSKLFCVAARIQHREFASAWGQNKKEAEQRAAANAMAELSSMPLPYVEEQASS